MSVVEEWVRLAFCFNGRGCVCVRGVCAEVRVQLSAAKAGMHHHFGLWLQANQDNVLQQCCCALVFLVAKHDTLFSAASWAQSWEALLWVGSCSIEFMIGERHGIQGLSGLKAAGT